MTHDWFHIGIHKILAKKIVNVPYIPDKQRQIRGSFTGHRTPSTWWQRQIKGNIEGRIGFIVGLRI